MSLKGIIRNLFYTKPEKGLKEGFYLQDNEKYNKYNIGIGTYGKPRIQDWNEGTTLSIGNYCSIASNVTILLGGEHRSDWITTYPFVTIKEEAKHLTIDKKSKGDVSIGHDVWIGTNSTILSGVSIGNGAIIGAGSVVTKDIPDYAIYAGNPAKFIKFRFTTEEIEKLNTIAWWYWDENKLIENYAVLLSENLENFLKKNQKN